VAGEMAWLTASTSRGPKGVCGWPPARKGKVRLVQ